MFSENCYPCPVVFFVVKILVTGLMRCVLTGLHSDFEQTSPVVLAIVKKIFAMSEINIFHTKQFVTVKDFILKER